MDVNIVKKFVFPLSYIYMSFNAFECHQKIIISAFSRLFEFFLTEGNVIVYLRSEQLQAEEKFPASNFTAFPKNKVENVKNK